MSEEDVAPQKNTLRRFVWNTVQGFQFLRAFWGRRLVGGAIGLMADALAEGAQQAFFQRLPGHSQQAADSLTQSGLDRDLLRFRGESTTEWIARVVAAWGNYEEGGTPVQLRRVVDQWGNAAFPSTWALVDFDEFTGPFTFTLTIQFGSIDPPWIPEIYGGGHTYGESGFFYGLGASTDVAMLRYLVRKWKRASSRGLIKIYWSATDFVTLVV